MFGCVSHRLRWYRMRNFAPTIALSSSAFDKLMSHRASSASSWALLLWVIFLAKIAPSQNVALAGGAKFTDTTKAAGISFVHFKGSQGTSINLEEFGPGVCVGDFDNDGWPDIYFVNGRDRYNRGISVQNALYRNNKDGTFADLTDKAAVAGLESGRFHSGAVFFDYDRDGYLDLYVGSYVQLEPDGPLYCTVGTVKSSCPPQSYQGSPNVLYHNNGYGTFTDVSKAVNLFQSKGKNLAVGAADYDNDGWPDLFVANDGMPAYLYHNQAGKFSEIAASAYMVYNADGKEMAAMCISLGDDDNDGWLDLYISDFQAFGDHP